MHVLVVTVVHHPEDARIRHRQIRALRFAGHRVTYVAPFRATSTPPPLDVRGIDVPRAAGRRRMNALLSARRLLRALRHDVDLIVLHDPELLLSAAGMRLPTTVWDVHEDTASALIDKRWLPSLLQPLLRRGVISIERYADRRLHLILAEDSYRQRFARNHPVVPNDVNVPTAVLASGNERVVYVGRISRGRGAEELLAVPECIPQDLSVELVGPVDQDVRSALTERVQAGTLRWHGQVPNDAAVRFIDGALAGLSLLHDQPNYRYSRPTKIIEYMAHAVPVITTPTPTAAAIIDRHKCGIIVPFQSPGAVCEAIHRLRDQPELRNELGRRGREAALTYFDWRRSGPRFVDILERWAREGG